MLLLYFEGLGLITGFVISYFRKVVEREWDPRKQRRMIAGFCGTVALGFTLGIVWYIWSTPSGDPEMLKFCLMGFVFSILPGLGLGMLIDFLVRKYIRK